MSEETGSWKSGILTLLIVAAAAAGGWWLLNSGPQTTPEEEVRAPIVVRTMDVKPLSHDISVAAFGTVVAARQLVIEPEVSGPVIRQHALLIPGGRVKKGEELLAIDPTLAQLDLEEADAAVERSEAELKESRRKRDEAKRLESETLLSKTELAALEADLETEMADLKRLKAAQNRAEELLRRHKIIAPFNALVLQESVEIGQRVVPGFSAATLVGSDEFWVRAALPIDQLKHVRLPEGDQLGALVNVYLETGGGERAHRQGNVIRLLGDMEREGRLARALVHINNPLDSAPDQASTPFLIGSYVRVEIDAGKLDNVLEIDRAALRDGNHIWVVTDKNELQIKDVEVVWRKDETMYIKNALEAGESLIVSPLKVALPGMKVNPEPVEPSSGAANTDSGG